MQLVARASIKLKISGQGHRIGGGQPGPVLPQILALKDRGILTDGQAGTSHHLWDNSEKAVSQGWYPDLISTDIGAQTPQTPNGQLLPWVMTQFLHLGLTVEQVIERVTLTPPEPQAIFFDDTGRATLAADNNATAEDA